MKKSNRLRLTAAVLALLLVCGLAGCAVDPIREMGKDLVAVTDVDLPVESADGTVHSRILLRDSLISTRPLDVSRVELYALTVEDVQAAAEALFPDCTLYAYAAPGFADREAALARQSLWLERATPEVLWALYGDEAETAAAALAAPIPADWVHPAEPEPLSSWAFQQEDGLEVLRLVAQTDELAYVLEARRGPGVQELRVELLPDCPSPMDFERKYTAYAHSLGVEPDRAALDMAADTYLQNMNRGLGGWRPVRDEAIAERYGAPGEPISLRYGGMLHYSGAFLLDLPPRSLPEGYSYPRAELQLAFDGTLLSGYMLYGQEEAQTLEEAPAQNTWEEALGLLEQDLQSRTAADFLPAHLPAGEQLRVELDVTLMQSGTACIPESAPGSYLLVPGLQFLGDYRVYDGDKLLYSYCDDQGEAYLVSLMNLTDGSRILPAS